MSALTIHPGNGIGGELFFQSASPFAEMFAPKAIALIGASEGPGSVGKSIFENLRGGGFSGDIFPINPNHAQIFGIKAYKSIREVPKHVDLAIIATPAHIVPHLVDECAEAGVTGAVIISAGFKECGETGRQLEKQIEVRRRSMRVIGPNCLGVMIPHAALNATFAANMALSGKVAFLSQSGALCTAVLDWSLKERIGFSAFISMGSMLDVDWADLFNFFGDDPHTESIVCYIESIGEARKFLSAAREVSFTKPIIAIKVGRSEAAAKAAASHTGAMTGSDAVLDAAFRRAGVLRVNTIEELFDMAEILGKQPLPKGPRLAIVTNAGGPGALAVDSLVSAGGEISSLGSRTQAVLNDYLPPAWSHGNPVDILGEANAERYARAIEVVLKDPNTDGVLVLLTPQAMTEPEVTAHALVRLSDTTVKPILASWMGGASLDSARTILNDAKIPTYDYPDAAAHAFAMMWHIGDARRALYERPISSKSSSKYSEAFKSAECLIHQISNSGRSLLTEIESKQLLSIYGIPVTIPLVANTENEAVHIAEKLGYPVAVKVFSKKITHKSDVGGVKLDLRDSAMVRHAWRTIENTMEEEVGEGAFDGVTVQPFISTRGAELIIGSSTDSQLGPMLLFGAGGEFVEAIQDQALALPPLTTNHAYRLMRQTHIFKVLQGFRSHSAVDLMELAELLVRFSHLVVEQPRIKEIEINPLLVSSSCMIALDARVILHGSNIADDEIPQSAIRPYPAEYGAQILLKNGSRVTLRPIRPDDEEALGIFHGKLSGPTISRRYFGPLALEKRIQHDRLSRICFADYARQIPIVAERKDDDGTCELIGVGRINRLDDESTGELALLVADSWQVLGLGTHMLEMLVRIARAEKLLQIIVRIGRNNPSMHHVCKKLGFHVELEENGESKAELTL